MTKLSIIIGSSSSNFSFLNCQSHTWHEGPRLCVKLQTLSASVVDQNIYVAGIQFYALNSSKVMDMNVLDGRSCAAIRERTHDLSSIEVHVSTESSTGLLTIMWLVTIKTGPEPNLSTCPSSMCFRANVLKKYFRGQIKWLVGSVAYMYLIICARVQIPIRIFGPIFVFLFLFLGL